MPTVDYEDDEAVSNFIETNHAKLGKRIEELKSEQNRHDLYKLLKKDGPAASAAIKDFLSTLPAAERQQLLGNH